MAGADLYAALMTALGALSWLWVLFVIAAAALVARSLVRSRHSVWIRPEQQIKLPARKPATPVARDRSIA